MRNDPDALQNLTGSNIMPLDDTLTTLGVSLPILLALLYIFQKMTAPITARNNAEYAIEEYSLLNEPLHHNEDS
jgi:hypothetical protein